jgi:hypothetical protein
VEGFTTHDREVKERIAQICSIEDGAMKNRNPTLMGWAIGKEEIKGKTWYFN